MQLIEIRNSVKRRAGLGDTDPLFTDTVMTALVNDSLRRVSVRQDWPWLEATGTTPTVAGTETLAGLPAFRKVRWLRWEDRELPFTTQRDRADWYGESGAPERYTEEAGSVIMLPKPDAVYTVGYGIIKDKDTVLVADSDTPLIPDWAIELVISDTGLLVARRKRDREMERVYYAELMDFYNTVLDDIIQTTEGFVPRRTGQRAF